MSAIFLPEELKEFITEYQEEIDGMIDDLGNVLNGKPLGTGICAAQIMLLSLFSRIPEEDRRREMANFVVLMKANVDNNSFSDDIAIMQ